MHGFGLNILSDGCTLRCRPWPCCCYAAAIRSLVCTMHAANAWLTSAAQPTVRPFKVQDWAILHYMIMSECDSNQIVQIYPLDGCSVMFETASKLINGFQEGGMWNFASLTHLQCFGCQSVNKSPSYFRNLRDALCQMKCYLMYV